MSVKNYLKEIEGMTEKQVLDYLDELANEMKERVINTESEYYARGRIIYVSAQGDDANDGLSQETPIRSIDRIKEMMEDGDTFLFRRGDMFRGSILIEKHHITFSAYGKGKKPIFNSSLCDYACEDMWKETDAENVWECTQLIHNVGIVHYNTKRGYGDYDEICGYMMVLGRDAGFSGYADLKKEYTFYSDLATDKLYIYSKGNPGKVYDSLEIGGRVNAIRGRASHLTVDNLHIQHCGAHGVQDIVGSHLTVTNCIFDWLGGSILEGFRDVNTIRYGNAIEVGRCDGYLVKNNWMYQIYDTGITHQTGPQAKCDVHQYDVMYLDNLVEYCYWSLEVYNGDNEFDHDIKNVYMNGNFCRFGGFGWGCKGREKGAPMFASAYCCPNVQHFSVENNIFDRCTGILVLFFKEQAGNERINFRSNAYIQLKDYQFLNVFGKVHNFDDNAKTTLSEILGDKTATTYSLSEWFVKPEWAPID